MHTKSYIVGSMARIVEDACRRQNVPLDISDIMQKNFCQVDALRTILESKVFLLTPEEHARYEALKNEIGFTSTAGNEVDAMVEFLQGYCSQGYGGTPSSPKDNPPKPFKLKMTHVLLGILLIGVILCGVLYAKSSYFLIYATRWESPVMAHFFLSIGADPNYCIPESAGQEISVPLQVAVLAKNEEMVKLLLDHGADPNWGIYDDDNVSFLNTRLPLIVAIEGDRRNLPILKMFSAAHCNWNVTNDDQENLLFKNSDPDIFKFLVEEGVNVNQVNDYGYSLLSIAIRSKNLSQIDILLTHGANPNLGMEDSDWDIHTARYVPMVNAVSEEDSDLEILQKLVSAKGNILARDKNGRTLLFVVTNPEISKYLVEQGLDVNIQDNDGRSSFALALENRNGLVVSAMIAAGADKSPLYEKDENGDTLFQRAIKNRDYDNIRFCCNAGFDINEKVVDGETPLGWTLHQMESETQDIPNNVTVPEYIPRYETDSISEFPSLKLPPKFNSTYSAAAHRFLTEEEQATYRGYLEVQKREEIEDDYNHIITLLCELGANVNEVDEDGCTWLYKAVDNHWPAITKLLLNVGCDINIPTNSGNTPLHVAAGKKLTLISYQSSSTPGLGPSIPDMKKSIITDIEIVKLLLDHHAAVDERNEDQATPLHIAVIMNHSEIVQLLINAGADVHAKNHEGYQPIHFASSCGVLNILFNAGADPNAKDNSGQTPLFKIEDNSFLHAMLKNAEDSENEQNFEIDYENSAVMVKFLLDHGANMNIKDNGGKMAYSYYENDLRTILIQKNILSEEDMEDAEDTEDAEEDTELEDDSFESIDMDAFDEI